MQSENPRTDRAADQRGSARETHEASVELEFPVQTLAGASENLSEAGILVTSAEALRVRLRIDAGEGRTTSRTGRLVRLQRMGDGSTGIGSLSSSATRSTR